MKVHEPGKVFEMNPKKFSSPIPVDGKVADTIRVISCYAEPSHPRVLMLEANAQSRRSPASHFGRFQFRLKETSGFGRYHQMSFPVMLISLLRHPREGAPMVAASKSRIPVINAGDGGHQHPTQTLADLMTIRSLKGRLNNLTIGLCGDLKFGRTVHSLINALVRYTGIRFVLISPEELRLPSYIREDVLDKNHIEYKEEVRLEDALPELDVLYMTRVQKERFFNEEDYVRMKDFYILDKAKLDLAPSDMLILHPLPRVNEISVEVDDDPRAVYFKQVQYAVYVRMALILTLLEVKVC